jgi:hypothetical protein
MKATGELKTPKQKEANVTRMRRPPCEAPVPTPQDCFRPNVSGICDGCGQPADRLHSPLSLRGRFCATCCPACATPTNRDAKDKKETMTK